MTAVSIEIRAKTFPAAGGAPARPLYADFKLDVADRSFTALLGPSGLGKTTLAMILAEEMGRPIRVTSGPVVEKASDLAGLLTGLERGDILFIDEIHALSRIIEEYLYPAMEDYHIDILVGQGPSARSMKLNIPRFTLVGATTRAGLLTSPLRDRFGIECVRGEAIDRFRGQCHHFACVEQLDCATYGDAGQLRRRLTEIPGFHRRWSFPTDHSSERQIRPDCGEIPPGRCDPG